MKVVEHSLPGDGFGATVRSHQDGDTVVVSVGVFVLARWCKGDVSTRDAFIVAGGLNGMRGVTLAALASVTPSYVTRVLQRYQREGAEAILRRGKRGRKPVLDAKTVARARQLQARGYAVRQIAKTIGAAYSTLAGALKGARSGVPQRAEQPELSGIDAAPVPTVDSEGSSVEGFGVVADADPVAPTDDVGDADGASDADDATEALRPGALLAPDGASHTTRYAGTLLAVGALSVLGLESAIARATISRSKVATYSATQALTALAAAWTAGFGSIEAMHERDARALGVVMGLERSPSVRTLWRAIDQMTEHYDPMQWWAGWMVALMASCPPELPVWGVDGHFKAYGGDEPIDKGWNTKRRMAERGLATVRVSDLTGVTWSDVSVRAHEGIHAHIVACANALREAQGSVSSTETGTLRPVVLAFDRGGFDLDELNLLAAQGHWYLTWVPSTVKLPDLATIAPSTDGVGEAIWTSSKLAEDFVTEDATAGDEISRIKVELHPRFKHFSRLLVQRDGTALVPAATNLPPWIDTNEAIRLLRAARGMEENAIKAARAFASIDHLDDRGALNHRADDRPTNNPVRVERKGLLNKLEQVELELRRERPVRGVRPQREINLDLTVNTVHQRVVKAQITSAPDSVPRHTVKPDAQRAELDERNRQLLLPLKNATDNARRWLLARLGAGLSPSAHAYDADTRARTLDALLKAPGAVRFSTTQVEVTLDLQLPPTAHRRLSEALVALDGHLRDANGRHLRFRLAHRATRADLPGER